QSSEGRADQFQRINFKGPGQDLDDLQAEGLSTALDPADRGLMRQEHRRRPARLQLIKDLPDPVAQLWLAPTTKRSELANLGAYPALQLSADVTEPGSLGRDGHSVMVDDALRPNRHSETQLNTPTLVSAWRITMQNLLC